MQGEALGAAEQTAFRSHRTLHKRPLRGTDARCAPLRRNRNPDALGGSVQTMHPDGRLIAAPTVKIGKLYKKRRLRTPSAACLRRPGCPARKKAGEQVPRLCNHGKAGADGCEIALDEIAYSLQFIKGYSASKVGSIGA